MKIVTSSLTQESYRKLSAMDPSIFDCHGNVIDPSFELHLGKRILKNLKEFGDKPNQIEILSGAMETNKSFRTRTIQAAKGLKDKGLKIGDIVVICANNHNDTSVPFIGCMYQGYMPVNLATGMTESEIMHILKIAPPKIVFSDPVKKDAIEAVLKDLDLDAEIILFGSDEHRKYVRFSDFLQPIKDEDDFVCEDFDPITTNAYGVCSSGSTGKPKLVAVTHEAITLQEILPIPHAQKEGGSLFVGSKILLYFSPMFWISGICSVIGSCIYGFVRIQCSQSFTPALAKFAIETYQPDQAFLAPSALYAITKYSKAHTYNFSSLKVVGTGGNAIHEETLNIFQSFLPNGIIVVGYGGTELAILSWCANYKRKSVGKIPPWAKIKIIDVDTGKQLGPNETGELYLKLPTLFKQYYGSPISTANAFDDEGYYKTGDLLYYDEDGYLYFVDRCCEVIKYGNDQVATGEVEAVIASLPEVLNAAVVGVPHSEFGQLPMAFVELVPGAKATAQQIKDVVKNFLSDYKQLRGGVVFLDKLPLTHSGKLDRKVLNVMKLTAKAK